MNFIAAFLYINKILFRIEYENAHSVFRTKYESVQNTAQTPTLYDVLDSC